MVVTSTSHMIITTNPYLILLFICIQEKGYKYIKLFQAT